MEHAVLQVMEPDIDFMITNVTSPDFEIVPGDDIVIGLFIEVNRSTAFAVTLFDASGQLGSGITRNETIIGNESHASPLYNDTGPLVALQAVQGRVNVTLRLKATSELELGSRYRPAFDLDFYSHPSIAVDEFGAPTID